MSAKAPLEKAKGYILRLLAIRPRSEKEIRSKLKEKGYPAEAASEAVSFFKDRELIDDLKFARGWVESRMRSNPKGDAVLSRELMIKGVSGDIIEKALAEKRAVVDEAEQAREIAAGLKEKNKGLPPAKLKKKIYDYLARRGFSYDVIQDCVNGVISAE